MTESVYWRLVYADGRVVDEPEDGWTILDSPPAPAFLVLTQAGAPRVPFMEVPLTVPRPQGYGPWKPIFYRQRHISLDGVAKSKLEMVVFGRGCEGPTNVDCEVWGLDTYARCIECPEWAVDRVAIDRLVMEAQ